LKYQGIFVVSAQARREESRKPTQNRNITYFTNFVKQIYEKFFAKNGPGIREGFPYPGEIMQGGAGGASPSPAMMTAVRACP